MPRIKLPGLSTYVPGEGFGSDIITPTLPDFANLQRLNLYGTAYSTEMDDSKIKYFSSVSGLPSGQSVGTFGIINENKRSGSGSHTLDSVFEPNEGTVFMMFLAQAPDSDYVNDRPAIGAGQGRFAVGTRFRGSDAVSNVQPWDFSAIDITQVTSNDTSGVIAVGSGVQVTANQVGRVIMTAVTKDIVNQEVTTYNFSLDYSAINTVSAALTGTVPLTVNFGLTGDNPEVTLLSAGYYNSVLNQSQMFDLWQTMKKTVGSAGAPV